MVRLAHLANQIVVDRDTWIISDTHFGHANIIKYCDRPYDHNTRMLREWKAKVKPGDLLLHLGDVTVWYKTHVKWAHTVAELPGDKYLILGNHDQHWSIKQWRQICGFKVIEPFTQGEVHFSHDPQPPSIDWNYNVHGHVHNHAPFRRYSRMQVTYFNASIEGMGYTPVKLGDILDELQT